MSQACMLLGLLLASVPASDATKPASPPTLSLTDLERIEKMLETKVENRHETPITLGKLVDSLNVQLGKTRPVVVLDARALGKEAMSIATTEIRTPPFPRRLTLHAMLRLAASQLDAERKAAIFVEPEQIRITSHGVQRQLYLVSYDIADILKKPFPHLPSLDGASKPTTSADPRIALMNAIATDPHYGSRDRRSDIQLLNGRTLRVHASIESHLQTMDLLTMLRRLADLAVVFETQVFEVDAAYYQTRLAPLLADSKNNKPIMAVIDDERVAELRKHSELFRNRVKLEPTRKGELAAWQHVVAYADDVHQGEPVYKSAAHGFSFDVQAAVSADRRSLRLTLWQRSTDLVRIDKRIPPKEAGLPAVDLELPILRHETEKTLLSVDDTQPFLLRVNWQPKDKSKKLIGVVTPTIWIEEEERLIREDKVGAIERCNDLPEMLPTKVSRLSARTMRLT